MCSNRRVQSRRTHQSQGSSGEPQAASKSVALVIRRGYWALQCSVAVQTSLQEGEQTREAERRTQRSIVVD